MNFWGVEVGVVVGWQVWIFFKLGVVDWNLLCVMKFFKVFQGQFFYLVGGIVFFEMFVQCVVFDGFGQDYCWLFFVVDGGVVGGVNFVVIVVVLFEVLDILVVYVFYQCFGVWVVVEEVVMYVVVVVGFIGLVIVIGCCIY